MTTQDQESAVDSGAGPDCVAEADSGAARDAGSGRPRTFTEQARREQLLDATIGQVAQRGYAGASLARIAEAAGITKAAVLYHVGSKDALIAAAYQRVLDALVASVGAAIDAAPVSERPAVYIRAMVAHLRDHPQHVRVLAEVGREQVVDYAPEARWAPLAGLIDAAAEAATGENGAATVDSRALALIIGGAIDGIVAERLADEDFDVTAAADLLVSLLPGD